MIIAQPENRALSKAKGLARETKTRVMGLEYGAHNCKYGGVMMFVSRGA